LPWCYGLGEELTLRVRVDELWQAPYVEDSFDFPRPGLHKVDVDARTAGRAQAMDRCVCVCL
jgi:hypothetical protein